MTARLPVLLWMFACQCAPAGSPVDRFTLLQNGVRIEVTAPGDSIVRLRAGRGELPEDASWAVPPTVRSHHEALVQSDEGDVTTLTTPQLSVRIDRRNLAIAVRDRAGNLLFGGPERPLLAFDRAAFRLRSVMPEDMHYFGLGDKTGPLDRRGQSFVLWNTDAFGFGPASDPLYKSIPYVLACDEQGRAFGIFLDNTWRSVFDFGRTERDTLALTAEGGPVDLYLMAGPDPKAVVEHYAYLTGTAPLMAQWTLGFQQSHWSYATQAQVESIADRLRAEHLPADVVYLDIDYQDRNRPFTVNRQAFPDLPGLVRRLRDQDLRLILITDLHVAQAPGQGYLPYDSGESAGLFLRNPDGSDYVGKVWPGAAVFPDFSRTPVRDWWGQQYRAFVALGVAGFWNDMNEPAIFDVRSKTMPLDVVHRIEEPGFAPRQASHAEMHNVYGMLNSRATYEGLRKLAPGQRPFVLTRASYAGGQRYAATWTGDNTSSWAHLALSTPMLLNLGLSGFAYAGDDIGGFAGSPPSAELLTRWIEVGAFNPLFRDHYQIDKAPQEPWVSGKEHLDIRRRYIEERYRLMPYLYALAEENSRTGLPIMRPVFLDYPDVLRRQDQAGSEFLLGDDILVALPANLETTAAYTEKLPGNQPWFDYWTGAQLPSGQVNIEPRLDYLPVFVRAGAIVARQPLVQSTAQTPQGSLELDIYAGRDCRGSLYVDDGVSFAYQQGQFLRENLTCSVGERDSVVSFGPREGSYQPWWKGVTLLLHGLKGSAFVVTLDGQTVPSHYDAGTASLRIQLDTLPEAAGLHIHAS